MKKKLNEIIDSCKEYIKLEMEDVKPLEEDKLKFFKMFMGINWETGPIFYNESSLLFSEKDDFEKILQRPKCELLFRVESSYFNQGVFVLNFLNDKEVYNILGG